MSEIIDTEGFECEYDEDSFTITWNQSRKWICVLKNGKIVGGISPWTKENPTWSATFDGIMDRAREVYHAQILQEARDR